MILSQVLCWAWGHRDEWLGPSLRGEVKKLELLGCRGGAAQSFWGGLGRLDSQKGSDSRGRKKGTRLGNLPPPTRQLEDLKGQGRQTTEKARGPEESPVGCDRVMWAHDPNNCGDIFSSRNHPCFMTPSGQPEGQPELWRGVSEVKRSSPESSPVQTWSLGFAPGRTSAIRVDVFQGADTSDRGWPRW